MTSDLDERVRAGVAAALGSDVRVHRMRVLSRGARHAVLSVALDRAPGRVVVKLADPATAPAVDLARTAAASALAAAAGVPVPEVLAVVRGRGEGRWDCLVSAEAPGTPWSQVHALLDPPALAAAHDALREVVRALQTVRLPAALGTLGRAATPVLTGLRRLHSGHLGDYVAWLLVGVAAFAALVGLPLV